MADESPPVHFDGVHALELMNDMSLAIATFANKAQELSRMLRPLPNIQKSFQESTIGLLNCSLRYAEFKATFVSALQEVANNLPNEEQKDG